MDSPLASVVPLSSLLPSFSSLHITKGNLQPLAEGKFCNGTSFCLTTGACVLSGVDEEHGSRREL